MKKGKKLELNKLELASFVTTLDKQENEKVQGGVFTFTTWLTQPGICGPTMV